MAGSFDVTDRNRYNLFNVVVLWLFANLWVVEIKNANYRIRKYYAT